MGIVFALTGCGGPQDAREVENPMPGDIVPFTLDVMVSGSDTAFRGRVLEYAGATFPPPDHGSTFLTFCTGTREKFLEIPLVFTVREGDTVLGSRPVQRDGCRQQLGSQFVAGRRGWSESDHFILLEDGSLLTNLNPTVTLGCSASAPNCLIATTTHIF